MIQEEQFGLRQLHIAFSKNNMDTKKILTKLLSVLNKLKRGYAGDIQAERDWGILLIVSGIVLLGSVAINAVFFARVYEGEPLSKNINTNPEPKETKEVGEKLKNIETIFEIRAQERQAFIDTNYPFIDPARN